VMVVGPNELMERVAVDMAIFGMIYWDQKK